MGEQLGMAAFDGMQPLPAGHQAAPEPFVFAHGPPHDELVNRAEFTAKFRGVEATVITHPSTEDWPRPGRYLFQLQVVPKMQTPAADTLPHSLGGLLADRRQKADKPYPIPVSRRSWPKRIAEKVKRPLGIATGTICVPAVDDLGLLRIELKPTFRKPLFQRLP